MDRTEFREWLQRVSDCPRLELERGSSCRHVVDQDWTTLLGWGNWTAKVAFVGANPHWKLQSARVHQAPGGVPAHEHAYRLSLEGFEGEPHFRYHRSILRNLRARDERLHEELPEELEYFGFFTEVAFCPSRSVAALPPDVPRRCFDKNVLPFIRQAGFNVVVSLGREASSLCVEQLVGRREAEKVEGPFHGLMFAGANGGPWVITSYHPNTRGTWSRAAVADRLYELFDRRGVSLA